MPELVFKKLLTRQIKVFKTYRENLYLKYIFLTKLEERVMPSLELNLVLTDTAEISTNIWLEYFIELSELFISPAFFYD